MKPERLVAFSDGVIAIIITIMVLEIKVPEGGSDDTFRGLIPHLPKLLAYAFSFIYVAIFWNNHHHLFKAAKRINGAALWANNAFLFFISLIPVSTAWMGEHVNSADPVAFYGFIFLMCGVCWRIMVVILIKIPQNENLAKGIGRDFKGIISVVLDVAGIALCFVKPYLGFICYILVASLWLIPDKRLESEISKNEENEE